MKTLSIRQWMIVGMLIFFASAALFYHFTSVLDRRAFQPSSDQGAAQRDAALDSAQQMIVGGAANWRDPQWQTMLRGTLEPLGVRAVIRDASGAEIYRTGDSWSGLHADRQVAVVEGGRQLGTVALFTPMRYDGLAGVSAALAILLALLFVRWQMGRTLVKPLEAMGVAARQIAGGDLNFTLPQTRVREVANVRDAFMAMGDGLRASLGRQAALEEERRFFIGAIAHDLRTPLFTLRGSLVGLEQGLASSPEKAARYIAVCRQKADQLDRLVSDLFAYTKAEYLEQTLQRERIAFGPLLERAADDLRPRAQDKGIAVTLDGPDDLSMVIGDTHLLERAIENLLDNALRHTPTGGEITVRWGGEPGRVRFSVADTGPGIATRDLPHLFDPLYRAETSRNPETGGVGLGLTIARRILRAHGGDLVAANRATGGAEFTGWLPP